MKYLRLISLCLLAMSWPMVGHAQLALTDEALPNPDNEPAPVQPVPSERQVRWNETEFYAFFHFGMNTFTGSEWGQGIEPETTFAPTRVPDPEQWLRACKSAGMKGGIAVVKHHDGFCLWPTATTEHCVRNSAGNGRLTNIPRDFARAARKLGMKYGFYVSPWDMSSPFYGTQAYIDSVFLPQCNELAQYGDDQFEMWFDGANGGEAYYGGQEKRRVTIDRYVYYDVPNLRYMVHAVDTNCVMWGVGGEARWIGNEEGYAGETNWSTSPMAEGNAETQNHGLEDYWLWNAGESDAKATVYETDGRLSSGWFWHEGERPRSAEELFKTYLETVGRNSTLILNFPPNREGRLPDADVRELGKLGKLLRQRLGHDLALGAKVSASATRQSGVQRTYGAANVIDGDKDSYWATDDSVTTASLTFDLGRVRPLHYVALQEFIRKGQRVQQFSIELSLDGLTWTTAAPAVTQTTIGYKRIIPLCGSTTDSYASAVKARFVRVNILKSKACPTLHTVSIY